MMRRIVLILSLLLSVGLPMAGADQKFNPFTGRADFTGVDVKSTDCSAQTGEGRVCWDTDDDNLCVGTGAACVEIVSGPDGTLAGTGPDLRWCPTGGDCFHLGAEYAAGTGTLGLLSFVTAAKHILVANDAGRVWLPTVPCGGGQHLTLTDGNEVVCADDQTGAPGAGDIEGVTAGAGLTGGGTTGTVTLTIGAGTGITVNADDIATTLGTSISASEIADGDHGDFTYATSVATLDADVVAAAEMADADHGDISWSAGVASVDANAVALTTDTTGNYAAGDAEAGAALTGDSATSFFSTGTLEVGIGGTGATTLTDGGLLLGSGTGAITALGVATNGQLPIGDGTTDPVLATLTGTADEITVTNGIGTITLDIPDPFIVGKGGSGAATFTDGGILLGSGTGAFTALGVATNGQIPVGDGTTDPVLATLTGTADEITVTNGAGTITLDLPDPLIVGKGGSGAATFTDGGLLLGSGTGAFTALGVAANGQVPIGDGTTDPVLATLTGTANQVVVTNGAGTITLSTPQATATTSAPTFANVLLAGTGPDLRMTPTGGDSFHLGAEYAAGTGTIGLLSFVTAGKHILQANDAGRVWLPTIACTGGQVLSLTDGNELQCVTDQTGAPGSGDIEGVTAGDGLTGGGTTGTVTLTVGAGTAIDVNADDVAWDSTEVEATTWGAGGNASNVWTFNLSGTDPTLTAASNELRVAGDFLVGDASPFLELRDTTDNVAYQWHLDTAESYAGLTLWRGTNTGSGFAIAGFPQMQVNGDQLSLHALQRTDGPGQLLLQGGGRVRSVRPNRCVDIEDLAAADDNKKIGNQDFPITIVGVGCECSGTCTTKAILAFEDDAGNAMTHAALQCGAEAAAMVYVPVTAGGALTQGEGVRFDVTNTPDPATDDYEICYTYYVNY